MTSLYLWHTIRNCLVTFSSLWEPLGTSTGHHHERKIRIIAKQSKHINCDSIWMLYGESFSAVACQWLMAGQLGDGSHHTRLLGPPMLGSLLYKWFPMKHRFLWRIIQHSTEMLKVLKSKELSTLASPISELGKHVEQTKHLWWLYLSHLLWSIKDVRQVFSSILSVCFCHNPGKLFLSWALVFFLVYYITGRSDQFFIFETILHKHIHYKSAETTQYVLHFLKAWDSRISNMTFPCVMKVPPSSNSSPIQLVPNFRTNCQCLQSSGLIYSRCIIAPTFSDFELSA